MPDNLTCEPMDREVLTITEEIRLIEAADVRSTAFLLRVEAERADRARKARVARREPVLEFSI